MTKERDTAPLILTAAFVLLIIALNLHLFTQPIVEFSDYAANSLLVQQAKHFTLMTGHYSRWRFHHPGPAFMYLFALGEFLFYDVLHVVPAPYNGQLLIAMIFDGVLLSIALCVFRRHAKLPVPLALLVVLIVLLCGSPSLLTSNWMPDVMMFPFLLFTVSAASVLAGETRDLRYLALSGMLLIHAHFAQFVFVGVVGGGTVGYVLWRRQRQGQLRAFLSERRRDFALAAAIVFVFAFPPLLEIILDHPNNLDALLEYRRQFGDVRNSLGMAIGYFACFLLFVRVPEVALAKGPAGIMAMGFSRPAVVAYWIVLALLFLLAVAAWRKATKRQPTLFLSSLTIVGAVSAVLFLYWGTRIVGGFFAFNGNFIYALHLLAWFTLLAVIEPYLTRRGALTINVLALVVLAALCIRDRQMLQTIFKGSSEVRQAAAIIPAAPFGKEALTFDHDDWVWAVAVANSMKRLGKSFCVSPDWGFMFSRENVCPDMLLADKLAVSSAAVKCAAPCSYVYRSPVFSVTRNPSEPLNLPLDVGVREAPALDRMGFNEAEGPHRWLKKHASIRFRLSPELPSASCFRLELTGFAYPERPTQVAVNGRTLATLSKNVPDTAFLAVPREALHPGEVNTISLNTEKAGPVGGDKREIGFGFVSLVLRAATPDESCAVGPAAQPDYFSIGADWAPSCYGLEGTAPDQWRWCGPDSLVVIHNSSSQPKRVTLSAELSTEHEKAAPLKIHSATIDDTVAVSRRPLDYVRTFTAPPGDQAIVFTCNAPRSGVGDPRNLVLRVEKFQLEPAGSAVSAGAQGCGSGKTGCSPKKAAGGRARNLR
jgi:hypothetical protein